MKDGLEEKMPKFYGAVAVGKRGQIVIPVEARRDMDIASGEKLIILGGPQGNMLMITKAESMLQLLNEATEHISMFESLIKSDKPPK